MPGLIEQAVKDATSASVFISKGPENLLFFIQTFFRVMFIPFGIP